MKTDKEYPKNKAQPCGFNDLRIKDNHIQCEVCGQTVSQRWLDKTQITKIYSRTPKVLS